MQKFLILNRNCSLKGFRVKAVYEKRKRHLFAQNKEIIVPRTNNSLEQFFFMIRLNVRKKTSYFATGRLLSGNGDKLVLFQNLGIPDYVKQVYRSINVATKFASYKKELKKNTIPPMTRKKILELVDKGKETLKSGTVRNDPYSDEVMEKAANIRRIELI